MPDLGAMGPVLMARMGMVAVVVGGETGAGAEAFLFQTEDPRLSSRAAPSAATRQGMELAAAMAGPAVPQRGSLMVMVVGVGLEASEGLEADCFGNGVSWIWSTAR